MRRSISLALIFIAFVLASACVAPGSTQEESAKIATDFVKNEATFKFDGMPESLRLTDTVVLECPSCWEFHFEYQSRNSGYGDRKDVFVAAVITPHSARVVVENGVITTAVLDDRWDMKAQRLLEPGQERRR